jgi:hypothetical protein
MADSLFVVDRFSDDAVALRAQFDAKFADPRRAFAHRFAWDYWNIPGQYTALRTPAWIYFGKALYQRWHNHLVQWGRRVLGCHDVSPPWLSNYVEGCKQDLHGDLPHGPWAFVYSLTPWQTRAFSGGETMMLRDEVLDFWSRFESVRSVELADVLRLIEPRFNRLTVFDPRIPHGVREVRGTVDPRQGRLVMHGWFVNPRPFISGPMSKAAPARRIAELIAQLHPVIEATFGSLPVAGLLSFGIAISAGGVVTSVKPLSDTTRVASAYESQRRKAASTLLAHIRRWQLPKAAAPSHLTLPLVFER